MKRTQKSQYMIQNRSIIPVRWTTVQFFSHTIHKSRFLPYLWTVKPDRDRQTGSFKSRQLAILLLLPLKAWLVSQLGRNENRTTQLSDNFAQLRMLKYKMADSQYETKYDSSEKKNRGFKSRIESVKQTFDFLMSQSTCF